MKKFKFFLLIPVLAFLQWSQPAHSLAASDAPASQYSCPPPFTKVDGKPCCTFKPSCPAGFEISQSCGTVPPNGVQLTFCCVKKEIPFDCPKPAEVVLLPPDQCKKLNGVPDPNANLNSANPARCCFNCAKAGIGYAMINGITSKEKCQPVPPNIFLPTAPGASEGKCCAKSGSTGFECSPPSQQVAMTSELCKKLGGTVNPNNIEMCCLRCSNPKGWQDVRKEECPSPPNFFYPSTSFAGHVNCCYTNGGSAPTPTPVPSPSPGSSTSATVGTTSNTGSLNGVCQIYQGCVVGTVNGQQGCYTSASITAGTYQACSPAAYLWTNANGFKQCCKNAQP